VNDLPELKVTGSEQKGNREEMTSVQMEAKVPRGS
jgi:hypothetical protein